MSSGNYKVWGYTGAAFVSLLLIKQMTWKHISTTVVDLRAEEDRKAHIALKQAYTNSNKYQLDPIDPSLKTKLNSEIDISKYASE